MAPGLPDQIGRYRIQAIVGIGGFATVYRAVDERLDATVAVKVLAENHSHDPDLRERFLKEGQVLRRIDGPHVLTVHDLGETDSGQPYLVLDHADRGNLAERVAQRRAEGWRPAISDVMYVSETVADALTAIHSSELIHRDVAPRNLLIRSARVAGTRAGTGLIAADERLLLADLGLSKDLATASGLTVGGGTAGYTPPEQRAGLGHVDARADIWAGSALLVWLLLGRPPDDGGTWQQDLAAAGWSDALCGTLARGLATSPADRYGSAPVWFAAVNDALVATTLVAPDPVGRTGPIGTDAGPGAPTDTGAPEQTTVRLPTSAPSRPPARRWLTWLVTAGLGALLGAGGLALTGIGDSADSPEQTVDELADGRVRVEVADGDQSVVLVGPAEVGVGEPAVFEAEGTGVDNLVWFGSDGQVHVDETQIEVTATEPGQVVVTVVGADATGASTVTASHRLEVL